MKKLSSSPGTTELVEIYEQLIASAGIKDNPAHNVILTTEWLLVIPRACARHGNLAANAASMVGMVWVTKEEDLQEWLDKGPMEVLCKFGIRKEQI